MDKSKQFFEKDVYSAVFYLLKAGESLEDIGRELGMKPEEVKNKFLKTYIFYGLPPFTTEEEFKKAMEKAGIKLKDIMGD